MRNIFYKIELKLEDGKTLPITVATPDINNIEPLVNKNKVLYSSRGLNIVGLQITDTLYTFNMTEEEYQTELMYCDIVDE